MAFGLSQILDPFQGSGKDVYGSKPVVPPLATLQESQAQALAANQANFGNIAKLATQFNTLNQEQLNALSDKTLGPGVRQQILSNLASEARGEIPQDVQSAIFRGVAERTASGNAFGGGGFMRNLTARDLGLTSLDITNKALSSAESWLAASRAPLIDAASMFGISTNQQYQANIDQYNRQLLANKIAAAPDPAARGEFDSNMAIIGMALSAYGGGPGYQGTYRPADVQPLQTAVPQQSSYFMPQTSAGFGSSYTGGLAAAAQSAGVNNPYSLGGYQFNPEGGGGGGLGGLFK